MMVAREALNELAVFPKGDFAPLSNPPNPASALAVPSGCALLSQGAPPPSTPETLHRSSPYHPAAPGRGPPFLRASSAARRIRARCSLAAARCAARAPPAVAAQFSPDA